MYLRQIETTTKHLENKRTRKIQFSKMHGAGNEYIYVNTMLYPISNPEAAAIEWSKYHTGIGSDGLVLIGKSEEADFSMRIFNADGSEAMMCGNASYCVGKYLYDYGLIDKTSLSLKQLSGVNYITLNIEARKVTTATVDMGSHVETSEIDFKDEYPFSSLYVSVGNPHLVTFVDKIEDIDLPVIGPKLENHPFFPNRINAEFAQVLSEDRIRMRVWERGSGITQACGTGACATTVAAVKAGKIDRKATIIMDGGELTIEWNKETDHLLMTGTPKKVFDGTITISE